MEFLYINKENLHPVEAVILPISQSLALSALGQHFDEILKGELKKLLEIGDFSAESAQTWLLPPFASLPHTRFILVGTGEENKLQPYQFKRIVQAATRAMINTKITSVLNGLSDIALEKDFLWKIKQIVLNTFDAMYSFTQNKTTSQKRLYSIKKHYISGDTTQAASIEHVLKTSSAVAKGMYLTKDLANTPANICTPRYLSQAAKTLAENYPGVKVTVLEKEDIVQLKMNSFLAVSKGSRQPPQFICLEYHGDKQSDSNKGGGPIVLIGKGITFDAGGISLKPGADMDYMKYDMSGAASVLGTFKAIAELNLPISVVGLIPTCENMPDGDAIKPGDIVTSMSGQTIEILNTDAEGRLILCDALTYAQRYKPRYIIDIATLTGAIVISLGSHFSGLFTQNDALAQRLEEAGEKSFDRVWRLPLTDDYQEPLNSNFADMANIGDRSAGSITAACFLSRFTTKEQWAHLDIAGAAYLMGKEKGSTGRPVALLTQFLMGFCE